MKTLLATALLALAHPAMAATTYYVANSGIDANAGNQAAPFRTIQKAADVVSPGDLVIVKAGTYIDDDNNKDIVSVRRGGTASAWVTFRSETRWGARIDGQSNRAARGWMLYAPYVRIEGFDVFGTSSFGFGGYQSHVQVVGNRVHHIGRVCADDIYGRAGIFFGEAAANVASVDFRIEGNVFHDIGRLGPGDLGCQPTNHYWMNHDHGLYFAGLQDVLISNNVFYNHTRGWAIQLYGYSATPFDRVRILNNTFAFPNPNREGHILLGAPAVNNSEISNNVFYKPLKGAVLHYNGTISRLSIRNNWTTGATTYAIAPPAGATFSGNRENAPDPLFASVTGFDFRLQSASPVINQGLTSSQVPTDIVGTPRPQGAAYDLGAYEFAASTPMANLAPAPPTGLAMR